MLGQHMDMPFGREARGLAGFGGQVQHQGTPGRGGFEGGQQPGHQDMRNDAGEPRSRSQDNQVGMHHRVDRLAGGRRITGQQADAAHLPRCGGHRHLPANHPAHPRITLQPGDVGLDLQGERTHRQHPALDPQNSAEFVEGGHRIGEYLVEPGQHEITDRMAGQRPAAAEAVLDDGGPQPAVRAVGSQGGQRHSQIAGRHDVQLGTQPTR